MEGIASCVAIDAVGALREESRRNSTIWIRAGGPSDWTPDERTLASNLKSSTNRTVIDSCTVDKAYRTTRVATVSISRAGSRFQRPPSDHRSCFLVPMR